MQELDDGRRGSSVEIQSIAKLLQLNFDSPEIEAVLAEGVQDNLEDSADPKLASSRRASLLQSPGKPALPILTTDFMNELAAIAGPDGQPSPPAGALRSPRGSFSVPSSPKPGGSRKVAPASPGAQGTKVSTLRTGKSFFSNSKKSFLRRTLSVEAPGSVGRSKNRKAALGESSDPASAKLRPRDLHLLADEKNIDNVSLKLWDQLKPHLLKSEQ